MDETLVLDAEPSEGTDPEPLEVSDDPDPDVPTWFVEVDPPLAEEAIGEETLLTWLLFGIGIDTVKLLPLGSPARASTGNWTNGRSRDWCGLNFAVAGEIRTMV